MGGTGRAHRGERIDALDALRGVLAIGVMIYHLLLWLYDIELNAVGSYSVYMFFVLSGFAMTWVYFDTERTDVPVRSFYVARIARIAPLWWVAVVGTVVVSLPAFPGWNALVQNLTFLSALGATRDIPVGGWSIEVEVVFYLLFPALIALVRTPRALAVATVSALVIRMLYVSATWPGGEPAPSGPSYLTMPSFLVFFLGGMLAAQLRRQLPRQVPRLLGASGLVVVVAVLSLNWVPLRELLSGPLSAVLVLASIVGVGLVACTPNPSRPWVRWCGDSLGQVSYGAYLLHPIVYLAVRRAGLPRPMTVAVVVSVTLVLAWCSNRWFEMPAARWVRSRAAGSMPAATGP